MFREKKRRIAAIIVAAALLLLLAAAAMGCVDYDRVVNRHERPICAMSLATADDGGSGRYYGLGYGFEIEGNFVPMYSDEGGVREWSFYILGVEAASGMCDYSASTAS